MFFDPLSAWLVVLIADGVILANEKIGVNSSQSKYERERINELNIRLNDDIRRIKKYNGSAAPEHIYKQIKFAIDVTMKEYPFSCGRGQVVLDLYNQRYIIDILEKCAIAYSTKSPQKAAWYKNAANEARGLEKKYAEMRKLEKEKKEKQENKRIFFWLVVAVVIAILSKVLWG